MSTEFPILRTPSEAEVTHSNMARYMRWLTERGHGEFRDYAQLHAWSVRNIEAFWQSIWDYTGVIAQQPAERVLGKREMPGAEWFPGARLNFAENLLREALHGDPNKTAMVARSETRERFTLTYGELLAQVGALEAYLRSRGIGQGDRVAGLVANTPEAIIALLACASIGAIWSSASPDFGVNGVHDRFGQIEPKALIAVNGYGYGGKTFSRIEQVNELRQRIPSIETVVYIENLPGEAIPGDESTVSWSEAQAAGAGQKPTFTPLPFDQPVYILYSSGTTGVPKCIVHGAGGALLQHSKELMLHGDIRREDVFFYFTTCGWMMWNWLASGLVTGAELVIFDGNPAYPGIDALWQMAEEEKVTHFGTSAKFLGGCRNAGLKPGEDHDLSALRVIFSTGSPLLPEDYDWVYSAVKQELMLASIAGGTDIVSCFVGGSPLVPVRRGEIPAKGLGMDVKAYDDDGHEVVNARGELVCTQPAPCMPVAFWNDPDMAKYKSAYFETFPGVWAHGDYILFNEHGGSVIYGRSDATLNPGGVRIGTAEIYRQVETLDQIADSIVVGQPWDGDVRVVLLVVMNPGQRLTEELQKEIRTRIRQGASPRHVPAKIVEVSQIPYTRSGKKVEIAVAKILRGEAVKNREALTNPEALDEVAALEELKH
ncbi:acetoacetate--CoA ligase [Alkalilimnicola sp. S0819]|uniref:acetoacetate--CoA ligase n=1 Tax=Alkalilimnicola sp. S0819 TaxID=2613922 RepID=UPI0012628884|nr:acetoacetate--CoA ligase [Alkalilimnicola sp. S0819]KAB7627446.1 acetoacetate--CoA ligase [Alkalilimnicola sp. S0819]MPQ15595.1 acetoacetate--CoA ligase [Alkalilimnicola sp. S0819]